MNTRARLLSITALLALSVVLSGCIFPNDTTTNTDRTLTITPLNETNPDRIAAPTTTQYGTLSDDAQTALDNGSVTTWNDLNEANSPYTYYTHDGSVYRLDRTPAGTEEQVFINATITIHKNEPSYWETSQALDDYPAVDQAELKPHLNTTAGMQFGSGGGRGGSGVQTQFTYDETLRYPAEETPESDIVGTDQHNILYDHNDVIGLEPYRVDTSDQQRRTVQLHEYTARVVHDSNESYAQAFAADNTVDVSLNNAERDAFTSISQADGPVAIESDTERALAQKFERYRYPTAYYTTTESTVTFTRVDGQLYRIIAAGPNVPSPFNASDKEWTY